MKVSTLLMERVQEQVFFPKGAYKIGRFTIKDDHEFSKHNLSVDDIVMFFFKYWNFTNCSKINRS